MRRTEVLGLRPAQLSRLVVGLVLTLAACDMNSIPRITVSTGLPAISVVVPAYEIETLSNGRTASQPGVPNVPQPVDVDGDLVHDILVSVNLTNNQTLLQGSSQTGNLIAPNIEIVRHPIAIALGRVSPPLRVQIKLMIRPVDPSVHGTVLRFGYDTGHDGGTPQYGSIPARFRAVLYGLDTMLDPLKAEVSTFDPDTAAGSGMNGYEGPLDLVVGVGSEGSPADVSVPTPLPLSGPSRTTGEESTDLRFGYRPFPGQIEITYSQDKDGHHVLYQHSSMQELDLDTTITMRQRQQDKLKRSRYSARVERLPRKIGLDVEIGNQAGKVTYRAVADGRRPAVRVETLSEELTLGESPSHRPVSAATTLSGLPAAGEREEWHPAAAPLIAQVDVEALPAEATAHWSFPHSQPISVLFCAGAVAEGKCLNPGAIGSISAELRNYYGESAVLPRPLPQHRQTLTYQSAPGGRFKSESRISVRADEIRELRFDESADGFAAGVSAGDGEQPFALSFHIDQRSEGGNLMNGSATVTPLPDEISVAIKRPGTDQKAQPLTVTYRSSKSVDVDTQVEIRQPQSGLNCGETGTLCAELKLRHIPADVEVRMGSFPTLSEFGSIRTIPVPTADGDEAHPRPAAEPESPLVVVSGGLRETRLEIDATPRTGSDNPDLFADLVVGQEDSTPEENQDDIPLIARATLLDYPQFVRIRTRESITEDLDRAEFHACKFLFDAALPACEAGTEGRIGALSFNVRNWTERPPGLRLLRPETDLYVTLAARGLPGDSSPVLFEMTGTIRDIAQLVLRNTNSIVGLSSKIGGGHTLSAHVDLTDIEVKGDADESGLLDLTAEAFIEPLPPELDLCFRQMHQPVQSLADSFTDPCESANPFNDATPALARLSPLSVAYVQPQLKKAVPFDVTTRMSLRQRGKNDPRSARMALPVTHQPADHTIDDHRVAGLIKIESMPARLVAHIETPPANHQGPIRALFEASAANDKPITVETFAIEAADHDLICEDPRVPRVEAKVLCARGRLENLPTDVTFYFDPTIKTHNLRIVTPPTGPRMNLIGGHFSSVEGIDLMPHLEPDAGRRHALAKVLVAEATLHKLPQDVRGTLDLPTEEGKAPTVDIRGKPTLIHAADLLIRNYVAPDPFFEPVRRREIGDFTNPTQSAYFRKYGPWFKAEANVQDLRRIGYRTVADMHGNALDTKVIAIDFGKNQVIHAHADIRDRASHTVADVMLKDVPAELSLCFRGERLSPGAPDPALATFCDNGDRIVAVANDDIAFRFEGSNAKSSDMDIDAFFRHLGSSWQEIVSGRVRIENLPPIVEGTVPSASEHGKVDFVGLRRDGNGELVSESIDRIELNVANFDLMGDESGYKHDTPYNYTMESEGLRPPLFPNQFLSAAFLGSHFHIRGVIGNDSQLQRLRLVPESCPPPRWLQSSGQPPEPPDYPYFSPPSPITKYLCVGGEFLDDTMWSPNPLDIYLTREVGGQRLSLTEAGLTDLPGHFQLTLADTQPLGGNNAELRDRCGTIRKASPEDCMPPLLRLDQSSNGVLYGVLRIGNAQDLRRLDSSSLLPSFFGLSVRPREPMANLDAAPTASDYPNWTLGDKWDYGLRAKIASFGTHRTAVKAGVRLKIPRSLTVDQIQNWSASGQRAHNDSGREIRSEWDASDTRFHYVVRDSRGKPVGTLGKMALLYQNDDGTQILLSPPCDAGVFNAKPERCKDFFEGGVDIPGEFGIDLYRRNRISHDAEEELTETRSFLQADGRVSSMNREFELGVRVLDGRPKPDLGRIEAQLLKIPTVDSEEEPGFRFRFEQKGTDEDLCSWYGVCARSDVRVHSLFAQFDFGLSRLVEAVVNLKGKMSQGVEARGFDRIAGGQPTPVVLGASLDISPMQLEMNMGIPVVGGFALLMKGRLQVMLKANANRVALRHDLFHIKMDADGGRLVQLGPMNFFSYYLLGLGYVLGEPALLVSFLPGSLPPDWERSPGPPLGPAQLKFIECGPGFMKSYLPNLDANRIDMAPHQTAADFVIWPLSSKAEIVWGEPRVLITGPAAPIVGPLAPHIGPLLCLVLTDVSPDNIPLIDDTTDKLAPSDPEDVPGHKVPGAGTQTAPSLTPSQRGNRPPGDLRVHGPLALCGSHKFRELTVAAGQTLRVSTRASTDDSTGSGRPDCLAGSEGSLTIEATTVNLAGAIVANGKAGSAGVAGNPGGRITIDAKEVALAPGSWISARGGRGSDGAMQCGGSVSAGSPGGAGGEIYLSAIEVRNQGTITARGGDGGAGGRGGGPGGKGGEIKLTSPLLGHPGTLDALGGRGGAGKCSSAAAGAGTGGILTIVDTPQSVAESPPMPQLWRHDKVGSRLSVPYSAALKDGARLGMQVFLCGSRRPVGDVKDEIERKAKNGEAFSLNSLFRRPNVVPSRDQCDGALLLGQERLGKDRDDGRIVPTSLLESGYYYGLWTVVRSDCQPTQSCVIEQVGSIADVVIAIDNLQPSPFTATVNAHASSGAFVTNRERVRLSITAKDQNDLSGLHSIECSNDDTLYQACANGENDWALPPRQGPTKVFIRATDEAGNIARVQVDGWLDLVQPDVAVSITPDLGIDWHKESPTITLTAKETFGPSWPSPSVIYRLDEGPEQHCLSPCIVDKGVLDKLSPGEHELHYSGVDGAGNRLFDAYTPGPMQRVTIRLDRAPPQSALFAAPGGLNAVAPNGANGWFVGPLRLIFGARDQPDASGIDPRSGSAPRAGVWVTIDRHIQYYRGPIEISEGVHEICWQAIDVAGNPEVGRCKTIKVDAAKPSVGILPRLMRPDGRNAWYVTTPMASVRADDTIRGSGITNRSPSGAFSAISDERFGPYNGPLTVAEGVHRLFAAAIDEAGQDSDISETLFKVDLSQPVSTADIHPRNPAIGRWWRMRPRIELRATDGERSSGVARIETALVGGRKRAYRAPFSLDSGVHMLRFRSVDRAHDPRGEQWHETALAVDTVPPIAVALAPAPAVTLLSNGSSTKIRLHWKVSDALSPRIRIRVLVYDAAGRLIRRIDDGWQLITPGQPYLGHSEWDGTDETVTRIVPAGAYYYRVVAADEAGNVGQGGESKQLQIKLADP